MPYIGKGPIDRSLGLNEKDTFTGDGSTVAFDLSTIAPSANAIEVFIDNVRQEPGSGKAYTFGVDGSGDLKRITFSAAPANLAEIYVINSLRTQITETPPDNTITSTKIVGNAVTGAKIADDSIDSEHYAAGSIDNAHLAVNSVDSDQYVDGSIDNAHLADNAVGLAEMAGLVRGKIIVGDASGDPSALAMGTSEQVLRVNTAGTDLEYADAVGGAAWALKTGAYTAVAGDGVMVDTDSSAITITLPISSGPPSLGDFVRVLDATGNAATNNITVARNGNNIQGAAADLTIATNRAAIGLVYVNATEGWVLIEN